MSAATAYLAGTLPRRVSPWRLFVQRLRCRGWQAARARASEITFHHHGRLFQDVVTGSYGTLAVAYPNRGGILRGARVHVRLVTSSGRSVYVPWKDARPADPVECLLWEYRKEGRGN